MAASISVIYSIKDAKGLTSTMEVHVPSGTSLTNAIAFGKAFAPLINAVITGIITRIGLVFSVTLPGGLRTDPGTQSDVEEGARMQFFTAGGHYTGFRIPTFNEDLIANTSREVDQTDTDVDALLTGMVSGVDVSGTGGTGTISPSDSRDEDVTTTVFAKEQFQSSRKVS